jgi:hypothetical protein
MMCAMSKVDLNKGLLLRIWLNNSPFVMLLILVMVTVFILGYALYVFERLTDYISYKDGGLDKENTYEDYMWLSIITLMTVGYGDMYPTTHKGRIIVILESIGGLLLTATLVGIIHSSIELNFTERKVISLSNNYAKWDKLRNTSASLLQVFWKLKKRLVI